MLHKELEGTQKDNWKCLTHCTNSLPVYLTNLCRKLWKNSVRVGKVCINQENQNSCEILKTGRVAYPGLVIQTMSKWKLKNCNNVPFEVRTQLRHILFCIKQHEVIFLKKCCYVSHASYQHGFGPISLMKDIRLSLISESWIRDLRGWSPTFCRIED